MIKKLYDYSNPIPFMTKTHILIPFSRLKYTIGQIQAKTLIDLYQQQSI